MRGVQATRVCCAPHQQSAATAALRRRCLTDARAVTDFFCRRTTSEKGAWGGCTVRRPVAAAGSLTDKPHVCASGTDLSVCLEMVSVAQTRRWQLGGPPEGCTVRGAAAGTLNEKSDVYAFGVVLLEVLTGAEVVDPKRPLANRNLVDWLYSRLHDIAQVKEVGEPRACFPSSSNGHPGST